MYRKHREDALFCGILPNCFYDCFGINLCFSRLLSRLHSFSGVMVRLAT